MHAIVVANALLLLGAALVLFGILSSLVASRFGTPLLLVFLVLGMLIGEDGPGGIAFEDFRLAYLVGSLALAIILFDGGLRTKLASVTGAVVPSVLLATVGVLITAFLTGGFATLMLGVRPLEAVLMGAIVASTDAAAVFFLLKSSGLQIRGRVNAVLEVESATNDPIAVLLTILLVEVIIAPDSGSAWQVAETLLRQGLVGAALGVGGGLGLAAMLNRIDLPGGLHPLFVVASAVALYALTALLDGSGFLAVYLAGLIVGNQQVRALASITAFHDTATWLAQIVMFILLGLLVTPSKLLPYTGVALAVAAFLIFVARPAAVFLCLGPFGFTVYERLFVSWVGLRGAVSIFLAAIPKLAGVPGADALFNVAFVVVLISLVVQGWTITPAAKRLGIALPRTKRDVRRVEIDLPGQLAHEMVGYPINVDSPVLDRAALPRWARPVFVVRQDRIFEPEQAGALKAGDYGYYLAPPERVADLDRLFAAVEKGRQAELVGFPLRGGAPLATLAALYDLEIAEEDRERTVSSLFAERFEGKVGPGDRLTLGGVEIVAREVDDGVVREASLIPTSDNGTDLAELGIAADHEPAPRHGHTLLQRIAARFRPDR